LCDVENVTIIFCSREEIRVCLAAGSIVVAKNRTIHVRVHGVLGARIWSLGDERNSAQWAIRKVQ